MSNAGIADTAEALPPTPWPTIAAWFDEAGQAEVNDPNAMSLATVGKDGMPSVRIMLLKGYDENGFVFYTNRESRKGDQLHENAKAAICIHWKSLRRQIRAEGVVVLTSDAESDDYFATRPRGSQIGAWASMQSRPLNARDTLESRVAEAEKRFEGKTVPRPPHWGGYRIVPLLVELWQDRQFRLHDRFIYTRATPDDPWNVARYNP